MTDELRLNLAHQNLEFVPNALIYNYHDIIKIIDVSNNKISDVSFLENFTQLNSVIFDHNEINSSVIFPYLPKVTVLWLNFNQMSQLYPFIKNINTSFPSLRHLSLMGNPIVPPCQEETYYEYLQYRLFVISWLEKLDYLDDRKITIDEKEEALRLYKRPFLPWTPSFKIPGVIHSAVDKFRQFLDSGPITGQRCHNETSSVI